jgi:hypothetical protein
MNSFLTLLTRVNSAHDGQVHGILVYSYEGRLVSTPKIANSKPELFTSGTVALSDDTLVAVDQREPKRVHVVDLTSGQPVGKPLAHTTEILEVAVDQAGGTLDRYIALPALFCALPLSLILFPFRCCQSGW